MDGTSVGILWDIENVKPTTNHSIVDAVVEYSRGLGKISVAIAYGNWQNPQFSRAASMLADSAFQLIHVPKAKKNSSDISLVTNAMEMLFLYPHITTYVLVTGDADFRPLILSMKRRGASVSIVCDAKSASEDLLLLADSYEDYRNLLSDQMDIGEDEEEEEESGEAVMLTREEAFSLLSEAVSMMVRDGKRTDLGHVKVRTKLLNDNFDEHLLGYSSWKKFVTDAEKGDFIEIEYADSDIYLKPTIHQKAETTPNIPLIILELIKAVDRGSSKFDDGWVPFSYVSEGLHKSKISIKEYGYNKFKKVVEAASKRGLVDTKNTEMHWFAKLSKEGHGYLE